MEIVKMYNTKKWWAATLVVLSLFFLIFGVVSLVQVIENKVEFRWGNGSINSILMIALGLLFMANFFLYYRYSKYFIGWDENKIAYWLPKNFLTKTIQIAEIEDIEINNVDVRINVNNKITNLHLTDFSFPERKRIKQKFEELKLSL